MIATQSFRIINGNNLLLVHVVYVYKIYRGFQLTMFLEPNKHYMNYRSKYYI